MYRRNKDRRSLGWSAGLLGFAALAFAVTRQKRALSSLELRGKVVLITGGSRGLGFAVAQQLALRGARLVLISRDRAELDRAKARLAVNSGIPSDDVFVQACDVSIPDEVVNAVKAATGHFGRIDVLVNNAGVIFVGPLESQTLDSFHQAMNINFYGALHTTLAVLPQMFARGDGAIVNIASIGGKVSFPHLLPYVASKFALVGWSQGLRAELASKGIQVTTVCPGIMRTGSHIQARYAGNSNEEYRWFASAASFPGTATSATTAAKKVVKALIAGSAEISIGLQAIAAARFSGIAPELTATLLSLANGLLPKPPIGDSTQTEPEDNRLWEPDHSVAGQVHRGSLPALLERLGSKAIEQYNQEPASK